MQNISAKVMTRHNFLITKAPSMKFITLLLLLRHVLCIVVYRLESERHILTTFQAQRRHDLAQKKLVLLRAPVARNSWFHEIAIKLLPYNRVRDTLESHLCLDRRKTSRTDVQFSKIDSLSQSIYR